MKLPWYREVGDNGLRHLQHGLYTLLLGTALDIHQRLAQDQALSYADRLERDRIVAGSLQARADDELVLGWWQIVSGGHQPLLGGRVTRAHRVASVLLALVGLLLGVGAGVAAFTYNGDAPINLLVVLGVLVLLPLLAAVVSCLAGVAQAAGKTGLSDTLAITSVGRWAASWIARYSEGHLVIGAHQGARVGYWLFMGLSQKFALGFFAGVVIVVLVSVTFTDLAFGWSSTLALQTDFVLNLFSVLAAPWASWWAEAQPTYAMVETSRFYRLEGGEVQAETAAALGAWWPFVLACVLFWGLLPRLLLALLSAWRYRVASRAFLLQNPEVTALLERLRTPDIRFGVGEEIPPNLQPAASLVAIGLSHDPGDRWIGYNDIFDTYSVGSQLQQAGVSIEHACLISALDSDEEVAQRLGKLVASKPGRVIIATKGWEPPTLEVVDFVRSVRQLLGEHVTIVVVPFSTDGGINGADRDVWAATLAKANDAKTYVAQNS